MTRILYLLDLINPLCDLYVVTVQFSGHKDCCLAVKNSIPLVFFTLGTLLKSEALKKVDPSDCYLPFVLIFCLVYGALSNYLPDVTFAWHPSSSESFKVITKKVEEWLTFFLVRLFKPSGEKHAEQIQAQFHIQMWIPLHFFMSLCFLLMLYLQTVKSCSIWLPTALWIIGRSQWSTVI